MIDRQPKRKYDSQRRQLQARATRQTILDAAQRLFERDGYVATTMDAIAAEAGVALKTVYSAVTTKAGMLRAVWDLVLKGDTEDTPVADRSWYREVLDDPDPRRKLRHNATFACAVKQRIGPMLSVIRSAAVVDPDGAALWALIQSDFHDNQRTIVESIARGGGLRPGLGVDDATDILWTLSHPSTWLLLVGERGWSPERFESWFADITCRQLLARPGRPSS